MYSIDITIKIKNENGEFQNTSLNNFLNLLEKIYKELKKIEFKALTNSRIWQNNPGCFCARNEIFMKISEKDDRNTGIITDDAIFSRKQENYTEYIARKKGYLVYDGKKITVFEPLRITDDKVHIFYIFFPVRYGKEDLTNDFFYELSKPTKDQGLIEYTRDAVVSAVNSNEIRTETISMGFAAKPGRQEEIIIKAAIGKPPSVKADGGIDYYSYSHFTELKKGDLIAEKVSGIAGIPGIDAFGKEISVMPFTTVNFTAGNNVAVEEKEDGIIRYFAEIDGILDLKETTVSILPELHITGDVGPETGSLCFSRNITIEGNIKPLYRIECGGNLVIKGQIENGAYIFCEGDLLSEKGIFGDKSNIFVKGNLETGFVTELKLRVNGDVVIHGTVYSSDIFCGGTLTVAGNKMKTKSRGCIVGSRITSMKSMTIHSAGSNLSKTELICGIDNELKHKQDELKKVMPAIDKKILRLQNGLGFDLKRKDLIENISKFSPEKKQRIKTKLEEIRTFAVQKSEIEKKIKKMNDIVMSPDAESLSIKIASHLLPNTSLQIGEKKFAVKKEFGPSHISILENRIVVN